MTNQTDTAKAPAATAATKRGAGRRRRMARPPEDNANGRKQTEADADQTPEPAQSPRRNKITEVIALLSRREGAAFDEMIAATGWLPHTTRAALTGLRKKGHAIERLKRGDTTCYRIVGVIE